MKSSVYYIYIIRCKNNLLYTGITTDITRRFEEHKNNFIKGAKFTRMNKPQQLEIAWKTTNRSSASKLEYAIKHLTKLQKEALITKNETLESMFGEKFKEIEYI